MSHDSEPFWEASYREDDANTWGPPAPNLAAARHHTLPGGAHLLSVFTDVIDLPEDLAAFVRRTFRDGEPPMAPNNAQTRAMNREGDSDPVLARSPLLPAPFSVSALQEARQGLTCNR